MSVEDDLVGTYRLISFENFAEDDGEVARPFGEHPTGMIIYTRERYMSAIMMVTDRPGFNAGDILGGTDEEKLQAFSTSSAYAGRWEIVHDQIIHHLDVTTYPNWTGTDQPRNFDLTPTNFTLYPPAMLMQGRIRRGKVHFERIQGPWQP
jgi:hypothetical protein